MKFFAILLSMLMGFNSGGVTFWQPPVKEIVQQTDDLSVVVPEDDGITWGPINW